MSRVRAASGPYAAELRASSPKMGIPAEGPTCSPCSSQLARGRPMRRSRIGIRLFCSCNRKIYVNGSLRNAGRGGAKAIGSLELFAQFWGLQVFAHVGEPL